MSITNGYTTLATFKARLDHLGSHDDAMLEQLIEAASRQIDGLCGRSFYQQTAQTRTFTPEMGDLVWVDDLVSVTSLATDEDGSRTYATTWASTDYDLGPENAVAHGTPYTVIETTLNGRYRFPFGRRTVQITGTWGWPAVPDAIEEATLLQAGRLFKRKDAPFGIAGSADAGQLQTLPGMDPDVKKLVEPYRRLAVLGV